MLFSSVVVNLLQLYNLNGGKNFPPKIDFLVGMFYNLAFWSLVGAHGNSAATDPARRFQTLPSLNPAGFKKDSKIKVTSFPLIFECFLIAVLEPSNSSKSNYFIFDILVFLSSLLMTHKTFFLFNEETKQASNKFLNPFLRKFFGIRKRSCWKKNLPRQTFFFIYENQNN